MALTDKQRKYVIRRLRKTKQGVKESKKESAIIAGYSPKTAGVIATKLEKNPEVFSALQFGEVGMKSDKSLRKALEKSDIENSLVLILERCLEEGPIYDDEPDENGEFKPIVYKQFNPQGALKAAELLGKTKGMFTDKLQVEGQGEMRVKHEISDEIKGVLDGIYGS